MAYSGERFRVVYRLAASVTSARTLAEEICIEQTVEFPQDLVTQSDIRGHVFGRVERLAEVRPGVVEAEISYAVETVGSELTQLVNVMFGNSSLKPGIRAERFELSESLARSFRGPRFGREGLRELAAAPKRALLCSAVKPMGLSSDALADLAYRMALGGVDFIKDDHGLSDQASAPYAERVPRIAAAVARANAETGGRTRYLPNVTAPAPQVLERARLARDAGAGGLLFSPFVGGLDAMRVLADDDGLGLPVFAHPALMGSYVLSPDAGFSHFALFGQLMRLAGADAVIFPSFGGRFSFSRQDCKGVMEGTRHVMASIRSSFPVPAGGMSLRRVPELVEFYGRDVMLLIGGDLHRDPEGVEAACRKFRAAASPSAS
jgi:ribulose-bisphosphate carboxylase large chain